MNSKVLPQFFNSKDQLRNWFLSNYDTTKEIWIGFYRKNSGLKAISYEDAVCEALCFGWIDGICKKVDDVSYTNRFTPRRKKSNWCDSNLKRFQELSAQNRIHPSGLLAYQSRKMVETTVAPVKKRSIEEDAAVSQKKRKL
jgi:uncharacterized protein YdeI (YjbR/CyaY-like superfamily)